jgi:hypothetical protein
MGELEEGAIKLTSNRATREEDGVPSSVVLLETHWDLGEHGLSFIDNY